MLDRILGNKIVEYLSEYCEITSDQVSLSVFSGKGTIDHLVLKPDTLSRFDLPVTISRAVIRHIEFEIPWTSLKSSPCITKISEILACVTLPSDDLSEAQKAALLDRAKQRILCAFEERRRDVRTAAQVAARDAEDGSYASRLFEIIMNNLIVEISNVHVRYECAHSERSGVPHTVVGFTLAAVKLQTTNEHGKPMFIDPTSSTTCHKKLTLDGLRLYSEADVGATTTTTTQQQQHQQHQLASAAAAHHDLARWTAIMERQLDELDPVALESCIFGPVRGHANVAIVQKKHILRHPSVPRVSVALSVENLAAAWSRGQYLSVVRAALEMSEAAAKLQRMVAPDPHEELWSEYEALYRKVVFHEQTPGDDARLKAITAVMPGESVLRCRKAVYQRAKSELADKKLREDARVKDMLRAREVEKERLRKEREAEGGFFSYFRSVKPAGTTKEEIHDEAAKKAEQWKCIESEFGIVEGEEDAPDLTDLPPSYQWLHVNVSVPTVSVKLLVSKAVGSAERRAASSSFVAPCVAELAGTVMAYRKFNRTGCMSIDLKTKGLSVSNPTSSRGLLPEIVFVGAAAAAAAPKTVDAAHLGDAEFSNLLHITADLKPLVNAHPDTTLDVDLCCRLAPLHVVLDPALVMELAGFFAVPSKARLVADLIGSAALAAATSAATTAAADLGKGQLTHAVTDTLGDATTMRISIDAAAPVIFAPLSVARLAADSPMLCASLGHFSLDSSPPTDAVKRRRALEISGAVAAKTVASLGHEILYDRLHANLRGVACAFSEWGHRAAFLAARQRRRRR